MRINEKRGDQGLEGLIETKKELFKKEHWDQKQKKELFSERFANLETQMQMMISNT